MVRRVNVASILCVAIALAAMLSAPALAGLYIPDITPVNVVDRGQFFTPDPVESTSSEIALEREINPADASADTANAGADQKTPDITVSVYDIVSGRTMILGLEEYIMGVAAGEMPVSFGAEALKAQAVAARSYALYKIAHDSENDEGHHGAQLCTDSAHCKAYVTREALAAKWGEEKADEIFTAVGAAVTATAGEIISYGGETALAVFHSCSDGATESAQAVWGRAVPYLTSVDTPEKTEPVVKTFKKEQIAEALAPDGVTIEDAAQPKLSYDDAGRVEAVDFGGVAVAGTRVRTALGLRSTDFSLVILDGEYIFTVRGYGHGVGMSQYGAAAMAAAGSDYAAILAHYYPGTALGKIPS